MTNQRMYTLAYCIDNKNTAENIEFNLSKSGYAFNHITCNNATGTETLFQRLLQSNAPILLLISDNFIKSSNCLYKGLEALQQLSEQGRIYPIIIDGRYYEEVTSQYKTVPTSFDRVSNVIQYMNHWQDQYLVLRKTKRDIPKEEEQAFDEKLKIIRTISSEVGEFLRYLRGLEYIEYQFFAQNDFEKFYTKIAGVEAKQTVNAAVEVNNSQFAEEKIDNSIAEETTIETTITEEVPDINIASIPGMDLLENTTETLNQLTTDDDAEEVIDQSPINEITPEEKEEDNQAENVLLNKLIEYKKDRMNVTEVDSNESTEQTEKAKNEIPYLEDNIDKIVEEILEEEQDMEMVATTESVSEEKTTDADTQEILDSIFEEEQPINKDISILEEEEEEEEEIVDISIQEEEEIVGETAEGNFPQEAEDENINELDYGLHLANEAIRAGETDKALLIFKNLVAQHPTDTTIRFQYASALSEYNHNYDEAIHQLELLLEQDRKNTSAYLRLAELAERQSDYLLAQSLFEKVVSLNPDSPDVYYKLGMITLKHFDDQKFKASKYFKKAIKHNKQHVEANYQYGVLLHEFFGKYKKAIKQFKQTLALDDKHPFANYDLALLYHKLSDQEQAAIHYNRACSINPEFKTPENDEAFKYVPTLIENEVDIVEIEGDIEQYIIPDEVNIPSYSNQIEEDIEDFSEDEMMTDIIIEEEEIDLHEEEAPIIEQVAEAPAENKPVTTKLALITGATSGIGKATAEVFAQHGYRLILTGRRNDRLEATKKALVEKYNSQVKLLSFDVRSAEAVKLIQESLDEEWSNIDILINNAGLASGYEPIHEGSIEDWDLMIDTNIKGLLYMTRLIAPGMVERKSGHIINVCSTAGSEVYPNGNVYCATKHAVDALTKSMRLDLHKHNIRVSQVSPGHVEETEFSLVRFHHNEERSKIYEDFQPLKSSDVAETIYFIASRPAHVNIQDILMMGTQQASNNHIDRSGR